MATSEISKVRPVGFGKIAQECINGGQHAMCIGVANVFFEPKHLGYRRGVMPSAENQGWGRLPTIADAVDARKHLPEIIPSLWRGAYAIVLARVCDELFKHRRRNDHLDSMAV